MSKAYIHCYYHGVKVFEKLKNKIFNAQKIKSVETASNLFETCKKNDMPYGKVMFQTVSFTEMSTMCSYPR